MNKSGNIFLILTLISQLFSCQKSEVLDTNELIIEHQDFGIEKFNISDANYNLYKASDNLWEFVIRIQTDSAITRSKKLESLVQARPYLEATVLLKKSELEFSEGMTLSQDVGYDDNREENLSNIYYFSHESVELFSLKILKIRDEYITAELVGSAVINGSNGNKPDAQIFSRTQFTKVKELRREVQ